MRPGGAGFPYPPMREICTERATGWHGRRGRKNPFGGNGKKIGNAGLGIPPSPPETALATRYPRVPKTQKKLASIRGTKQTGETPLF